MDSKSTKSQVDLLHLAKQNTHLEKVADTGGGEFAGRCPFCGGEDRFRVQPNHPNGGKWYCRGCGDNHWHDVIDYIMRRDNLDFREALEQLSPGNLTPKQKQEKKQEEEFNRPQWVESSYEFLELCIRDLWALVGEGARQYLYWRGLKDESIKHWQIGYNPNDAYSPAEEWGYSAESKKIYLPRGIVIPCHDGEGLHYLKIRRNKRKPKYILLKGGEIWPFGLQTFLNTAYGFLFEGEFDVMLAWQTGFIGVGYTALPAGQPIKKDYQYFFNGIEDVIVAYDNDEEGQRAADKLCHVPHFHKAMPFPIGNDLTEYWLQTSIEEVFNFLYDQLDILRVNNGP